MLTTAELRNIARRSGARDIANVEIDVILTHTGVREADFRIGTDAELLFTAIDPVLHSPELSA
jgi:hypothetical protein